MEKTPHLKIGKSTHCSCEALVITTNSILGYYNNSPPSSAKIYLAVFLHCPYITTEYQCFASILS